MTMQHNNGDIYLYKFNKHRKEIDRKTWKTLFRFVGSLLDDL